MPKTRAPKEFLDLVSNPREIKAAVGSPGRTMVYNILTKKNDLPNIWSNCRVTPVEITGDDPLLHQPRKVTVASYAPKGSSPEKLRTIILMPPTGGENALDIAYADHLCQAGFRVVLVQHWDRDNIAELDMDMHDRGAIRATAAVQDVVEFINPKGNNQLGILGTSVGAINSSLVLGVDSRISAGTLIVGGGGMAGVIGRSTEETLARLREARMKEFGFKNTEEYVQAISEHVKIDPLDFLGFAKKKDVLFFMGMNDITVPTPNQKLLYEAFGRQELVEHTAGDTCIKLAGSAHLCTILQTANKEKDRITDFFNSKLVAPTAEEMARAPAPSPTGNKLCLNARAGAQPSSNLASTAGEKDSLAPASAPAD